MSKALDSADLKKNQRQFLWLISAIVFAMSFVKFYKSEDLSIILLPIAAILVVVSFLIPKLIKGLLVVWFVFSLILSEITSSIFLGVLYFTLISLIRLFTRKKINDQSWGKRDKMNNFNEMY